MKRIWTRTLLSDGGAHIQVGRFVLDVLSLSKNLLQLRMPLLQITFRHLNTQTHTQC